MWSIAATLTPVRIPGSSPKTAFGPAGAARSRSFRLAANTRIASVSAVSRRRVIISDSNMVRSLTRQVQRLTSASHFARGEGSASNRSRPSFRNWATRATHGWGTSTSWLASSPIRSSSTPCWRPRSMARIRCEGRVRSGSLNSNQSRKLAPSVSLPSDTLE